MQMHTCTRELFAQREGVGSSKADPIFIVGLPRSGSTLLEQILASHSRVEGTHELADIQRIDRKSTRLNSSHQIISYAVFCLKKKNILQSIGCIVLYFLLLSRLPAAH